MMTTARSWLRLGAILFALGAAGCSGASSKQSDAGKTAAPASKGVTLSPSPAFATSRIDVVFDDPWIDPSKCQFVWKRNGNVISGAGGNSLEPSHFSRGERVSVEITAPAPGGGTQELTGMVDVVNTPPMVLGVSLTMASSGGSAVVQASVQSTDPDGDDVSLQYQWFKNGDAASIGTGPSLSVQNVARGDKVAVEVVAGDGQASTAPVRSEPFTVDNRPPEFTSQPRVPRATDKEFRYQAGAVDRDGDPLHYELVSAPNGMTVDATGMVVWPLPAPDQRNGEFPVAIKVTDSKGGAAVQEFAVRLEQPAKK